MNIRPSAGELHKKVSKAIEAINLGKRSIPFSKHFVSDQDDLAVGSTKDLWPLLVVLLEEVQSIGPNNCYVGGRPPQRSYEVPILNKELWAYAWESEAMSKRMYIKFCLVKNYYFYMGCHEDNPKGERG